MNTARRNPPRRRAHDQERVGGSEAAVLFQPVTLFGSKTAGGGRGGHRDGFTDGSMSDDARDDPAIWARSCARAEAWTDVWRCSATIEAFFGNESQFVIARSPAGGTTKQSISCDRPRRAPSFAKPTEGGLAPSR